MQLEKTIKLQPSQKMICYSELSNIPSKFVEKSGNKKTGVLSQTYTKKELSCPFCFMQKNGICYADGCNCHRVLTKQLNSNLAIMIDTINASKKASYEIRWNVGGDICINGSTTINPAIIRKLREVKNHLVYTYTHANIFNKKNVRAIQLAGKNIVINQSCENLKQVKHAIINNIPCVLVVEKMRENEKTVDGIKFKKCLAQVNPVENNCTNCPYCKNKNRDFCVVFEFHGDSKIKALYNKTKCLPVKEL